MLKKLSLTAMVLLAPAVTVHADGPRTLTDSLPAGAIESIALDTGVGDVEITGKSNTDEVVVAVLLTPRRGGFFSSKRQAEREVAAASLHAAISGLRLTVGIEPKSKDQRFEEHWTIEIPARLEIDLNHGVGDIKIRGVAGGLTVDSGVGEILIEIPGGDVVVNLGVGTAVIRAPAGAYASAEGVGGVGDARISVQGARIPSEGFVGHSARWTGDGTSHIEVEVGVGDAVINLK
ncbi:MAG: hypothetical protein ACC742_15260 [Thermoanaerobaculales bacterium]